MLFGKPPFETTSVETTYKKIQENNFSFPDTVEVSIEAKDLISNLLQSNPEARLTAEQILQHPFVTNSCIPSFVPVSSLNKSPVPRYRSSKVLANVPPSPNHYWSEGPPSDFPIDGYCHSNNNNNSNNNSNPINYNDKFVKGSGNMLNEVSPRKKVRVSRLTSPVQKHSLPSFSSKSNSTNNSTINSLNNIAANQPINSSSSSSTNENSLPISSTIEKKTTSSNSSNIDAEMMNINAQFSSMAISSQSSQQTNPPDFDELLFIIRTSLSVYSSHDDNEDISNNKTGRAYVTRWADFTSKYGLGFHLSNNTTGAYFNDETKMVSSPSESFVFKFYLNLI